MCQMSCRSAFLSFTMIILLAGCTRIPASQPSITSPSSTVKPEPSPSLTITPSPSVTPSPTATLLPMFSDPYAGPVPEGAIRRIGKGNFNDFSISPGGNALAIATGIGIYLYQTQLLELEKYIPIPNGVNRLIFSADGKALYAINHQSIQVIDPADGSIGQTYDLGNINLDQAVLSPDGKMLAINRYYDKGVDIWDMEQGKRSIILPESVSSITFSPDGKYFAGTTNIFPNQGKILIWTTSNWNQVATLKSNRVVWSPQGDTGMVEDFMVVTFSPDGKFLVGGSRVGTIVFWDTQYWNRTKTYKGPYEDITSLIYSANGIYLTEAAKNLEVNWYEPSSTINLWDTTTGEMTASASDPSGFIAQVAFGPDEGTFVTATREGLIKVRSFPDLQEQVTLKDFTLNLWKIDGVSPNGGTILSSGLLWDTSTGKLLHEYSDCDPQVMSPDGRLLASMYEYYPGGSIDRGEIVICDAISGSVLRSIPIPLHVSSIAFSPDSKRLAIGLDNYAIMVVDVRDGSTLHTLTGHTSFISALTFSPDGKILASGSQDTTIRLWDMESGTRIMTLKGHRNFISEIVFSPDGKYLFSGAYSEHFGEVSVMVWDLKTGKNLKKFPESWGVAYFPGYQLPSILDKSGWTLWNPADWTPQGTYIVKEHESNVFLPDGKTLVTLEGGSLVFQEVGELFSN